MEVSGVPGRVLVDCSGRGLVFWMTKRIGRGCWGSSICPSRPSLAIVMDLVDGVLDDSSLP